MPAPTIQQDIVVIDKTYGTPTNFNKAIAHKVRLEKTGSVLTKVVEFMEGAGEVVRRETELTRVNGVLQSATVKIYDIDGVTVKYQYTDTFDRTDPANVVVERTV